MPRLTCLKAAPTYHIGQSNVDQNHRGGNFTKYPFLDLRNDEKYDAWEKVAPKIDSFIGIVQNTCRFPLKSYRVSSECMPVLS